MKKMNWFIMMVIGLLASLQIGSTLLSNTKQQGDDTAPPDQVVKLIFIHHSSGENWLADENGGLGLALDKNNYFVSDTNYGWGPGGIGDTTDIPDWLKWFRSENSENIMRAVYNESGQNSAYTRSLSDPGGENQVILFKSCFPNSNLEGNPDDPAEAGDGLTVSNAKYVYNEILKYFASRPDKLFIVITAPPLLAANTSPQASANARAFNNWLVENWLKENGYPYKNVAVFDFFNILTGPDNHHRFHNGVVEHIFTPGKNTAYYPSSSDDDHPSAAGNQKATEEFIPLLNFFYRRWIEAGPSQSTAVTLEPVVTSTEPTQEAPMDENTTKKWPCLSSILLPISIMTVSLVKARRKNLKL